jgi:hypothetical protein
MRIFATVLLAAAALPLFPTTAVAATPVATVVATPPAFPSALQMAVLGLSLTAIVVVAARVATRTSTTMMYMVLASLTITGVMIAAADRIHTNFAQAAQQLQQSAAL